MQKELIISTTSQETKIAILENDELVEYYIERHRSQGIVGNIYKGKVTKVLPGMQSAFVDIGLERDAFLYVSDFLEDTEEYEKIVPTVEDEVAQLQDVSRRESGKSLPPVQIPPYQPPVVQSVQSVEIEAVPEASIEEPLEAGSSPETGTSGEGFSVSPEEPGERRGGRDRGRDRERGRDRDRDRRGKKSRIPSFESRTFEPRTEDRGYGGIEALPGESIAKFSRPVSGHHGHADIGHEGEIGRAHV